MADGAGAPRRPEINSEVKRELVLTSTPTGDSIQTIIWSGYKSVFYECLQHSSKPIKGSGMASISIGIEIRLLLISLFPD